MVSTNTIPLVLLREDIENTDCPHADVLYISPDLDIDYASRDGVLDYCRKVAEGWKERIFWNPCKPFLWQNFCNIPTEYLAERGLWLEQISPESVLTITSSDTL